MQVSYSRSPLAKSIFLAGPTPRSADVKSWRPEAVALLDKLGWTGTVFVPEDGTLSAKFSYDDQIEWELEALNQATVIVFWVPRSDDMPALTTNVEFGHFVARRNVVLGYPIGAPKMNYLAGLAKLYNVPNCRTLEETLSTAIELSKRPLSQND